MYIYGPNYHIAHLNAKWQRILYTYISTHVLEAEDRRLQNNESIKFIVANCYNILSLSWYGHCTHHFNIIQNNCIEICELTASIAIGASKWKYLTFLLSIFISVYIYYMLQAMNHISFASSLIFRQAKGHRHGF